MYSVLLTFLLGLAVTSRAQNATMHNATIEITLCNTRPDLDDGGSEADTSFYVFPDVSDPSQCLNYTTPLDWSKNVPLNSSTVLLPFNNNLTAIYPGDNHLCVAYATPDCTPLPARNATSPGEPDPLPFACVPNGFDGNIVQAEFMREGWDFSGHEIQCFQCGPANTGMGTVCSNSTGQ